MDQKIKELADSFFEWPTNEKNTVTLTSALLFAQKIAEITKDEYISKINDLEHALYEIRSKYPGCESELSSYAKYAHYVATSALKDMR